MNHRTLAQHIQHKIRLVSDTRELLGNALAMFGRSNPPVVAVRLYAELLVDQELKTQRHQRDQDIVDRYDADVRAQQFSEFIYD